MATIPLSPGDKAHMYALGGVMRGGVGRGGYVGGQALISIDGDYVGWSRDDAHVGVLLDSLTITDELDETPNRCTFRVNGAVPVTGSPVVVTLGSKNRLEKLFAGFALTVQQRYAGVPRNVQADVAAVDYTWLLAFALVTTQYRNQSATDIIKSLVASYGAGNGFTAVNVAPGLPVLDEITFTEEDLATAITRTVRRAGAYWYVDYDKDVHAFVTDTSTTPPVALTPTHASLAHVARSGDRTQALARVYSEGRGSVLQSSVLAADSKLPLATVEMFAVAPDVFVKASFRGSEGGALHLSFSGVVPGGGGALVGTGIGPGAAPTLTLQPGAGIDAGAHGYAVTFTTAAGESLPSPIATISTGSVPDPTVRPGPPFNVGPYTSHGNGSTIPIGTLCTYGYAYGTHASDPYANLTTVIQSDVNITAVSNQDPLNPTMSQYQDCDFPYSPDPRVKWIVFYQWTQPNGWWRYFYQANDAALGAQGYTYRHRFMTMVAGGTGLPPSNTTAASQVYLSNLPIGGATVTGRKIYRTKANLAPLLLLGALGNNTGTAWSDTAADSTLGAAVPVADTSGLQQPAGQVNAGSASLPIAGTSAFEAAGGWAVIGNGEQVIRYTGLSASALTGIPATGVGAITATVAYNTNVTAAPMLIGVTGITRPLTAGDEIYLIVSRENLATKNGLQAMGAGDGFRNEWISDRRLSITEARARADATLARRPLEEATLWYTCRDVRTRSGQTISVNLPAPTTIVGDFKIQQVTISNFRPHPNQQPTYTVQASTARFSFEDLLNRVKTKE